MKSKIYIQSIIDNIEQNISEKINVEKLSSKCFVSSRQLYRDFYSFTGHSINEYIRKRKLSKALNLLKYSEISITDIAYSCGYSSVQSLCRSIKSSLNITPTEYRKSDDIYYFPIYDGITMKQIIVKSQLMPQMICLKFFHSQLIGIENKAVYHLLSVFPEYTGTLFGKNGSQNGNRFCYELYIEYSEDNIKKIEQSEFNDLTLVPEYTAVFACTSVKNNEQAINAAWDYLYCHWLKNSMFEQDNTPYFEEYVIKDNIIKKLILNLPVKSRKHLYKINIKHFDERLYITATKTGINAEKSASNIVVDFVVEHYPFLLETQKELYVSKMNDFCTCGININNKIHMHDNEAIQTLLIPKGYYAVLEGSCFGSGNEYEQVLFSWLRDNGFETVGTSFTIYDTTKGMDQDEIAVKSQVMINDGRI